MLSLSVGELGVLDWIAQHFHCALLDTLMPFFSALADIGFIWILLGLLLLCRKAQRSTGIQVLLALILSVIVCNLILKNAVARIRPFDLNPMVELLVPRLEDPSFPSGHSSASFAVVTVLMIAKWRWRWVAAALAVLIAFSRLYLYMHFPTDVLGGICIGVLCGLLSVFLWKKWTLHRRNAESVEKKTGNIEEEKKKLS